MPAPPTARSVPPPPTTRVGATPPSVSPSSSSPTSSWRPAARGVLALLGAVAALALAAVLGVRLAVSGWPALVGRVPGDPTDALVAVVGAVAAVLAGWLALGLVACLLGTLPGALGRLARGCAARVAPSTLRRLAAAALGGALVVGALAPTAASAAGTPGGPAAGPTTWSAQVGDAGLSPDLAPTGSGATATSPTSPSATSTLSAPNAPSSPSSPSSPARPGATATTSSAAGVAATADPTTTPSGAVPGLGALSPASPRAVADEAEPSTVVVRRGDCLWGIAAAHLPAGADGASIARATAAWFTTNRAVVGPDPDHIEPGQVLRAPDQAGGR